MKIILAGIATILHLESLLRVLDSNGINYCLIENHLLYHKIPGRYQEKVMMTDELPLDADLIIPFNEYWISKILLLKQKNKNIGPSFDALYSSRSKLKLSETLSSKGIKSVQRFPLERFSSLKTEKIVIRPDGGYSGYGILFIDKERISSLKAIEKVIEKKIPKAINDILGLKYSSLICEEFIEGQEYSVDVFKNRDSINIIRLSKKKVTFINNIPCVIGYLQIKATPEFSNKINDWVNSLFEKDDISFAQFDFIENKNRELLPIDFSCRVGSGVSDLITNSAGANLYAYCIANSVREEKLDLSFQENWAQFNFIPEKYGIISKIEILWPTPHTAVHKRNTGDDVKKKHSGSAGNRILEIIELLNDPKLFDVRCQEINHRITVNFL